MKKSKVISLLVVVMLALSIALTGCASGGTETPSESSASSEAPAESSEAAESSSEAPAESSEAPAESSAASGETLSAEERAQKEVYQYIDDIAFGGIPTPVVSSRADINKALPVEQKSEVKVGWVAPTLSNSYFAGCQLGAQEQCDKYGYELSFLSADWDGTKQSADIESLITQGVDILIVDPVDTQAQLVDVQRAIDAGIPVIASGVPFAEDAPVITTITSNNYEGGYITGLTVSESFTEPFEMAVIMGQMGHPVANARVNGFIAGMVYGRQLQNGTAESYREDAMLKGYNYFKDLEKNGNVNMEDEGVNIVAVGFGSWEEVAGMTAAEDILTAHPEIELIFSENDHMGLGTYKALQQRGMQDQVIVSAAADGDVNGLEAVRDGALFTTGYNNSVAISKRCIDLVNMIFEQGYDANDMPIMTGLPLLCVTADNWEELYVPDSQYAAELEIPLYTVDEYNAMQAEA